MKKLHLLKTVLLLCALIVCSGNLWAAVTWERVTAVQTLLNGGTFIMGYEATAKSGVIVPLRSDGSAATTSANGILWTGTTAGSSTNGTINMGDLSEVTTSNYEIYISASSTSGYINIQKSNNSGNFYGSSSGGSSKNTARLYTSGNSNETNLLPEWASETDNQFKLSANVTGSYKYLKYNTGSPRFAFYDSEGSNIVFYRKIVTGTETTVTINGSYTETLYQGDEGTFASPTGATVKAGVDAIGGASVTWTSSNESVATINSSGVITLKGIGSTTIKASYAGNATYLASEASYTLNYYGVFTTMAELQAGCAAYGGTTAKPAKMSFSNVFVTAVKGNYAYISDGTNGAVVYKSGHGFAAGDKLTSTNLVMTIMNYNNYTPQITSLTKDTDGLTVLSGQEITPTEKTIGAITTANFGTLVKIKGVIYSVADGGFKDAGDNLIAYDDNFTASPALVDGGEYNVTGVILFKNSTTVKICPRTADDVVSLKASPETKWYDNTMTEEITSTTQAINLAEGAVKYYVSTLYKGAVTYESSDDEVATIASDGTITPVRYGMATITVSTPSTATYYASNVSFTLVVKDAKVDILTAALIGQSSSSYGDWTDKTSYSNTKYAGNSAKNGDAIQLRSSDDSGIVTTTTEGRARNIIVSWGSETLNERVLNVYGKNTPYTSAADLYSDATQGTLLGTIVKGTSSSLAVTGNYAYIGIRSNYGAVYLDYIAIEWNTSIPVTISSSQYATFCWPSKLDFSGSGLTAFTAESTGSKVELHEITDGIVPANAGVVLYGTAGDHTAEISSAAPTSYESLSNELVGVNARTSVAADAGAGKTNYILASKAGVVGFYKAAAAGAYLAANKAYLSTTTVSSHEFLGFDGDVTGIADVRGKMETAKGEYYNLAGQRVAQPTKGLYIVNGKKIIMK